MLKHVIFLAALAFARGQESYVQNLLGSELQGETLLKAYDAHYDGLTPEAQMGEKGVAQATPSLRRKLQSITWDVDGVEQTAPCDTPGAVHAAMCGRALSDAPCDTSVFEVGSVHAMNSGSCMHKARWYRVAAGDSDNTRTIFRCGPDEAPICAKDAPEPTSPATDCNTAYAAKDAEGTPLGHYNWDVGLLCSKNAGADLTAGGSSSSGPTNCHGITDGPTCDGEDDCAWGNNECHFSASSDSGPSCPKTVVADFQAGDDTDYTISIDGATAQADPQITLCEGDTLSVTRPDGFTGHPLRISDSQGNTVLNSNTSTVLPADFPEPGDYPYKCTVSGHESMTGIVRVLPSSDSQCACDSSSSDGPSEPPPCTYRDNQDDCDNTGDGRICVWDGSSCDKHPCDTIICSGDLVLKSPYPNAISLNLDNYVYFDQCCKPERKGCKDDPTSYTYDPNVDVHDEDLCFTEKTQTEKENDVSAVSGYLAKRGVHKGHAKRAFYKKRAEGYNKKAAIRAARETIPDDLPQRVKDRKKGTVKVAVAVNDATKDTCRAGVGDDNCVSLDLAEDRAANETTILLTEDEDGSWAVVADGLDLIIKQTRFGDKFSLQCWLPEHSDWSAGPSKSPSTDDSIVTHKCGSHVFMVGSLQQVCVDCTDGCDETAGLCYVPGCTGSSAYNYNAAATKDDGSCVAVANGCTDATASNYDASANTDDGSCVAVANGCTDATASNYDASANTDDGSCVAVANGCTDATACNYDASANTDDGSCTHAAANKDCSGACLNDADGDGVCDEDESEDAAVCSAGLTATQYIANQCCNTSPVKCS